MANRSYIYATNFDRTEQKIDEKSVINDLSESPYRIPLAYKILVSQQAKLSPSIIWEFEHPIAIQGDFQLGVEKLFNFLQELLNENLLDKQQLEQQIAETKEFLEKHQSNYILLECGEIFEMEDEDISISAQQLYQEVVNIDQEINLFIADCKQYNIQKQREVAPPKNSKQSFFQKLFSKNKQIDRADNTTKINEQDIWNELGINYWSDVLYFHFNKKEEK